MCASLGKVGILLTPAELMLIRQELVLRNRDLMKIRKDYPGKFYTKYIVKNIQKIFKTQYICKYVLYLFVVLVIFRILGFRLTEKDFDGRSQAEYQLIEAEVQGVSDIKFSVDELMHIDKFFRRNADAEHHWNVSLLPLRYADLDDFNADQWSDIIDASATNAFDLYKVIIGSPPKQITTKCYSTCCTCIP